MNDFHIKDWLPLILVVVGVVAWGVRLEAVAGGNKENVNTLILKSEKWSEQRQRNREAQIRYEARQEQIRDILTRQGAILEKLEQRTRGLTVRPAR